MKILTTYANSFLMLTLLGLLLLLPFLQSTAWGQAILNILFFLVMVAGINRLNGKKSTLILALILFFLALSLKVIGFFTGGSQIFTAVGFISDAAFLVLIVVLLLIHILKTKTVSYDTLAAAISVYLLLGVIFASIFLALQLLVPGSYSLLVDSGTELRNVNMFSDFIYFSFVCLTTLGFGDVTPKTDFAQTLCYFEAIIGQMFVAILIARLVGAAWSDDN